MLVSNGIVDLDALLDYLKTQPITSTTPDKKNQKNLRRRRNRKQRKEEAHKAAEKAGEVAKPFQRANGVNETGSPEQEPVLARNTDMVMRNRQVSRVDPSEHLAGDADAHRVGVGLESTIDTMDA